MTSKVPEEIARAREDFKETKVKSFDRTQELLEKRYRPDAVTPPQPEVNPEYEEHLEAQRRLDNYIAKRRQPQPQLSAPDTSGLPVYVQQFLERIK